MELIAKWGNKEFNIKIKKNQTLEELKVQLYSLTNVQPKRQKIIGLIKGNNKVLKDEVSNIKF